MNLSTKHLTLLLAGIALALMSEACPMHDLDGRPIFGFDEQGNPIQRHKRQSSGSGSGQSSPEIGNGPINAPNGPANAPNAPVFEHRGCEPPPWVTNRRRPNSKVLSRLRRQRGLLQRQKRQFWGGSNFNAPFFGRNTGGGFDQDENGQTRINSGDTMNVAGMPFGNSQTTTIDEDGNVGFGEQRNYGPLGFGNNFNFGG